VLNSIVHLEHLISPNIQPDQLRSENPDSAISVEESLLALLAELHATGKQAGLYAIGVAPVKVFEEARLIMLERREKGLHGGMHFTYSDIERATDPSKELDTARCLVVAAMSYPHPTIRPIRPQPLSPSVKKSRIASDDSQYAGSNDNDTAKWSTSTAHALNAQGSERNNGEAASLPPLGRIAAHAWMDRYTLLREALASISSLLQRHGWHSIVLTDSNALVDREAAWLAGLGWYGKNSLFFVDGLGSWVLLGSVLTDAPLYKANKNKRMAGGMLSEGDLNRGSLEQRSRCGGCDRCITSCPTSAIVAPGVLDARRCLAWLLQAPGSFPEEFREALGNRVYGCDTCQEACPINHRMDKKESDKKESEKKESDKKEEAVTKGKLGSADDDHRHPSAERTDAGAAKESRSSRLDGLDDEDGRGSIDLLWIIEASKEELLERLSHLYIPHRKVRYLKRNALVALGNYTGPLGERVWEVLSRAMRESDEIVSEHARWAWEKLNSRDDLQNKKMAVE